LTAFRTGAESAITGAILGALNVESPGGLDPAGIAIDGLAGGVFLVGSAFAGDTEIAPTARNIGAVCTGVATMRATTKLCIEKRLAKGQALPSNLQHTATHAGEPSNPADISQDPIVIAARGL
jgi:hypothetical protein